MSDYHQILLPFLKTRSENEEPFKTDYRSFTEDPEHAVALFYHIRDKLLRIQPDTTTASTVPLKLDPVWTTITTSTLSSQPTCTQLVRPKFNQIPLVENRLNEHNALEHLRQEFLHLTQHSKRMWKRIWDFDPVTNVADVIDAQTMLSAGIIDVSAHATMPRGFFRGQLISEMEIDDSSKALVSGINYLPPKDITSPSHSGCVSLLVTHLTSKCLPSEAESILSLVKTTKDVNAIIVLLDPEVSETTRSCLRSPMVTLVEDFPVRLTADDTTLSFCIVNRPLDLITGLILPSDSKAGVTDVLIEELVRHRQLLPSAWMSESGQVSVAPVHLPLFRIDPDCDRVIICPKGLQTNASFGRCGQHCICLIPAKTWVRIDLNEGDSLTWRRVEMKFRQICLDDKLPDVAEHQ